MKRTAAKQIVNGIIEFIVINLAYWVSGLIRLIIPFGKAYSMLDTKGFLPISIIYAAVIVLAYFFTDSYSKVRFSGFVKETMRLVITNLVGFGFMAGFMFVFRVSQFSRIMLIIFYFMSVMLILIERKIVTDIEIKKYGGAEVHSRAIVIGNGKLAKTFIEELKADADHEHATKVEYSGYVNFPEKIAITDGIDNNQAECLGDFEELGQIVKEHRIKRLYIAIDSLAKETIDYIMAFAAENNLTVGLVPVYTDYLSSIKRPSVVGNSHVLEVSALHTCEIMGVDIAVSDMPRTLKIIEDRLQDWKGKYICASNVHTTVMAYEDEEYRKVQNGAVMALPDGSPLSEFSRNMGYEEAQRVTGPDVMHRILEMSEVKGWSHYFYGSTDETLTKMKEKILEYSPNINIAGMYSPPFRPLSEQEDVEIIKMINETKADFLWVGLGAPKQEKWMAAHKDKINSLMVGVGAAFDYEAGNISRAPKWMQEHSLEWLYRLMQDPFRLLKRYVITNFKYLWWKLWQ